MPAGPRRPRGGSAPEAGAPLGRSCAASATGPERRRRPSASAARRRDRTAYLRYRLGAGLFGRLPGPLARGLASGLGRLAFLLKPAQRAVVAGNLSRVVPEATPAELRRLVRASYASYGAYWADVARLGHVGRRALGGLRIAEGLEVLQATRPGGAVLALPHLGSWEIGGLWAAELGFPLTTVAEPTPSPLLSAWFTQKREALQLRVLPLGGDTPRLLLATLRAGGVLALVCDRDVTGDGVEVDFFGAPTRLPAGPATLAIRASVPIFPCAIYLDRGGRHVGVLRPPLLPERHGRLRDDVRAMTQALAAEFEALISAAPEQWHVFQPNWPGEAPA